MTAPRSLREQVLRGGTYLTLRQAVALFVGFGGILVLTRLIGATSYGRYSGALAVILFLTSVGRLGVDVFLVRRPQEPDAEVYAQAFTLTLVAGLGLAAAAFAALPALPFLMGRSEFALPLVSMTLTLPFTLTATVALASLERRLDYRTVALVEVAVILAFYVVALPAAAAGLGVWSAVGGYWAGQLTLAGGTYATTRMRPRLRWSRPLLAEVLRYGAGYSSSTWIWSLRGLVNPLVVGRSLGPRGVAYVSLAVKFVEALMFVKSATYRLSIAALGRVQNDPARLRRAVEEGMLLQVLVVVPFLAGFAVVAPFAVPVALGHGWNKSLLVFPFIATGYLANSVFNMQISTLFVLGRNASVARFNLIHVAVFAAAAAVFVPAFQLVGYGYAELVAIAPYVLVQLQLADVIRVRYGRVVPWAVAAVPPVFATTAPRIWWPLLFAPCALMLASSRQRGVVLGYVRLVKSEALSRP